MALIWFGDTARGGQEIFSYVLDFEDTELVVLYKVPYDLVNSPIIGAQGWADAPTGAKEFTIITSNGFTKGPALILKNAQGGYDKVAVYKSKKAAQPYVILGKDILLPNIIAEINVEGESKQACRMMKLLDLAEDGTSVRLWVSNSIINFLRHVQKRDRKYEAALVFATRSIVDLLDARVKMYWQALLDMPCRKGY